MKGTLIELVPIMLHAQNMEKVFWAEVLQTRPSTYGFWSYLANFQLESRLIIAAAARTKSEPLQMIWSGMLLCSAHGSFIEA